MKTLYEIEWEIEQLHLAIEYYEEAISKAFFVVQVEEYAEIIHKLNQQIKKLERLRNDRH